MDRRLPLAALALQAGKAARCAAALSLHFTDSDMDSDLPASVNLLPVSGARLSLLLQIGKALRPVPSLVYSGF